MDIQNVGYPYNRLLIDYKRNEGLIYAKARISLGNISEEASLKSLHNKWFSSCESPE